MLTWKCISNSKRWKLGVSLGRKRLACLSSFVYSFSGNKFCWLKQNKVVNSSWPCHKCRYLKERALVFIATALRLSLIKSVALNLLALIRGSLIALKFAQHRLNSQNVMRLRFALMTTLSISVREHQQIAYVWSLDALIRT